MWMRSCGLVDRLNLWVFPVLLGSGKRLFAEGTVPTALRLVESATSADSLKKTRQALRRWAFP